MNYQERITQLQNKDNELNKLYREELLKTLGCEDVEQSIKDYENRMAIKTRWYRLELYKIMKV